MLSGWVPSNDQSRVQVAAMFEDGCSRTVWVTLRHPLLRQGTQICWLDARERSAQKRVSGTATKPTKSPVKEYMVSQETNRFWKKSRGCW